MEDFLENVKLYLKIQEEMGIYSSKTIQISTEKLKELSQDYSTKVKLAYINNPRVDYPYWYQLSIDGIDFLAVENEEEIQRRGLTKQDFKEGAEIWG